MQEILLNVTLETLKICGLVFVMMVVIDLINVYTKGRLLTTLRGTGWRQYGLASFLGATPGCWGAFANVSMYVHGLLSFGALVGGMIATSGDEAFVMLSLFPKKAIFLFAILFIMGIGFGWLSDRIAAVLHIKPSPECQLQEVHPEDFSSEHYWKVHIWQHIICKHLWRVLLWTFTTLIIIEIGMKYWNIGGFVSAHLTFTMLLAALVGIIPTSGPHLIFVMMFSRGLVPFSVLLVSSIVQDGHGMLPMLSYSIRDSFLIKVFNVVFGFIVGAALASLNL